MTTDLALRLTAKDLASGEINKVQAALEKVGIKADSSSGPIGKVASALGSIPVPAVAVAGAVVAAIGVLGDFAGKAIDEQKNIAALGASLRANIPDWNGNTTAIEQTIAAREKLAFSDDDLRGSLATLVGATHDVQKAFDIQSTAMDLARYKGISLQDASTALIKVEGGQYRSLKALGIVLKDGATQTDALAAVQAVAAGQAQAFGDTTQGSMESAGIAIQDVEEDIGSMLLPTIKNLAVTLRDDVIPAVRDFGGVLTTLSAPLGNLNDFLGGTGDFLRFVGTPLKNVNDGLQGLRTNVDNAINSLNGVPPTLDRATDGFNGFIAVPPIAGKAADDIALAFQRAGDHSVTAVVGMVHKITGTLRENQPAIGQEARDLAKAMKDPIAGAVREKALVDTLTGKNSVGKQMLAGLKSSDPLVVEAARQLRDDLQNQLYGIRATFSAQLYVGTQGKKGDNHHAEGGVAKGWSWVGEEGPELAYFGGPTPIMPNGPSMAMAGGAGDLHVHFESTWPPTPAQAKEIVGVIAHELHYEFSRASASAVRK